MKKTVILLNFSLIAFLGIAQNGSIKISNIGSVYYTTIPGNIGVTIRNDSIATLINNYLSHNAPKRFPVVLLYISDQDRQNQLSNFEEIKVYYQKFKGEFFNDYDNKFSVDGEHIGIQLSVFDNHVSKAKNAIHFAVKNYRRLKRIEKKLFRKKEKNTLTDEDLEVFELK